MGIPPENPDVEAEANKLFSKVFSADDEEIDKRIDELIQTMQKYKVSEVKREQEIYACMLHSLFDEYRFFHKYPHKYLERIAMLFGSILSNRIIDGMLQDIALKFVLEAFKRENKRQKFSIIAIKRFFNMLPEFKDFFQEVYNLRHLLQNDPDMKKDIETLYNKTMKEKPGSSN